MSNKDLEFKGNKGEFNGGWKAHSTGEKYPETYEIHWSKDGECVAKNKTENQTHLQNQVSKASEPCTTNGETAGWTHQVSETSSGYVYQILDADGYVTWTESISWYWYHTWCFRWAYITDGQSVKTGTESKDPLQREIDRLNAEIAAHVEASFLNPSNTQKAGGCSYAGYYTYPSGETVYQMFTVSENAGIWTVTMSIGDGYDVSYTLGYGSAGEFKAMDVCASGTDFQYY